MPKYTATDNTTGKSVSFEWHAAEPPTDADLEEVFAEARTAAPAEPERTWTDTAVDALPFVGGAIGGLIGAPTGPGAIGTAAIGGAGGEGFRRAINSLRGKTNPAEETPGKVLREVGTAGVEQGVGQAAGMGVAKAAQGLGKLAMRGALGAQTAVRRKFPTVDLESIALREGVGVPGVNIPAAATAANKGVSAAGRAADAAGGSPVQPREMVRGLRPLMDRAKQTRDAGQQQQIVEAANDIRKRFRGGIGIEDSLATKSDMASQASSVMQGAADPRTASTSKKILGALSRSTGDAAKSRGAGVPEALTRSQELMALDKAMQGVTGPSRLRLLIGAGAGVGSGVASGDPMDGIKGAAFTYALSSPRALSGLAQLLSKGAPVSREATRALAALMSSHEE